MTANEAAPEEDEMKWWGWIPLIGQLLGIVAALTNHLPDWVGIAYILSLWWMLWWSAWR